MKTIQKLKVENKDFNIVSNFLDYLESISGEIWELIAKEYPRCDTLYDETGAFLNFLRDRLEKQKNEDDYN